MYSHLTLLEFNVFVCFVFVYLFVVCLTSLRGGKALVEVKITPLSTIPGASSSSLIFMPMPFKHLSPSVGSLLNFRPVSPTMYVNVSNFSVLEFPFGSLLQFPFLCLVFLSVPLLRLCFPLILQAYFSLIFGT